MFEKRIEQLKAHFQELEAKLANPETISNQKLYTELTREYANTKDILEIYDQLIKIETALDETEQILDEEPSESELAQMAQEEKPGLLAKKDALEKKLKLFFIPKDKRDEKNTIVEIRAGTGGEEAALFAGNLFRMYKHYAEHKGWQLEILDSSPTGLGGFKEIIFSLEGPDVFRHMRYESGTHRVQRVPETEASGRIHTSAATVAVLPEADEVEIKIDQKDLRIDVFRSSGPGGQSVNTMDSAVRITYIPTGLVVQCQDGKSQRQNKVQAMKVLRSRLLAQKEEEQTKQRRQERKSQVGTGDRSEKIRTYNFPQGRVTDHRIGLTLYKLEDILNGEIDEIIEALIEADYAEELAKLNS